jgi:hypothetical protein
VLKFGAGEKLTPLEVLRGGGGNLTMLVRCPDCRIENIVGEMHKTESPPAEGDADASEAAE